MAVTARTLQACVRARQIVPWPTDCEFSLRYHRDDPLVVRLVAAGYEHLPWEIGRDLLADGLVGHAGYGDVRLWPESSPRGELLLVVLAGDGGDATFELPAPAVRRFLARTYRQVPRGAEADLIDLDRLVARLLAETP